MLTMNGAREDVQQAFCELAAITTDGPGAPLSWLGAISTPRGWVADFQSHVRLLPEWVQVETCAGFPEPRACDAPPFNPVQAWHYRSQLLDRYVTKLVQPCVGPQNRNDMALITRLVNEVEAAGTIHAMVRPHLSLRSVVEEPWPARQAVGLMPIVHRAYHAHALARMSRSAGMIEYGRRLRRGGMTEFGVGNYVGLCSRSGPRGRTEERGWGLGLSGPTGGPGLEGRGLCMCARRFAHVCSHRYHVCVPV